MPLSQSRITSYNVCYTKLLRGMRLGRGQGVAGWVAEHGQPALIADVRQDPRFSGKVDPAAKFVPHSLICVPICSRDRVFGVIELVNGLEERPFRITSYNVCYTKLLRVGKQIGKHHVFAQHQQVFPAWVNRRHGFADGPERDAGFDAAEVLAPFC